MVSCIAEMKHVSIMACHGLLGVNSRKRVTQVKKIVGAFAERIATLSSGLFTGASVYINLV